MKSICMILTALLAFAIAAPGDAATVEKALSDDEALSAWRLTDGKVPRSFWIDLTGDDYPDVFMALDGDRARIIQVDADADNHADVVGLLDCGDAYQYWAPSLEGGWELVDLKNAATAVETFGRVQQMISGAIDAKLKTFSKPESWSDLPGQKAFEGFFEPGAKGKTAVLKITMNPALLGQTIDRGQKPSPLLEKKIAFPIGADKSLDFRNLRIYSGLDGAVKGRSKADLKVNLFYLPVITRQFGKEGKKENLIQMSGIFRIENKGEYKFITVVKSNAGSPVWTTIVLENSDGTSAGSLFVELIWPAGN